MTDLHIWKNFVSLINAERLNAMRNLILTNEDNISDNALDIAINASLISELDDEKLDRNGSQWMQGDLNMSNNMIINITTPTLYHHATNKSYVDEQIDNISAEVGASTFITLTDTPSDYSSTHLLYSDSASIKYSNVNQSNIFLKDGSRPMIGNLNVTDNCVRFENSSLYDNGANNFYIERNPNYDGYVSMYNQTTRCYIGTIASSPPKGVLGFDNLGTGREIYWYLKAENDTFCSFEPFVDNFYDIGSSTKRLSRLYVNTPHFDNGAFCKIPRIFSFHLRNLSATEYLLGTGTVNTMYPFNETVTITNYVINYDADTNSRIDIELADINGFWHSNSLTESAAGGYQDNKSFTARTVSITDKLQIKLHNVSDINYMNFVLNYK